MQLKQIISMFVKYQDGIDKNSFVTNRISSKMIKKYNSKEAIDAFEDKVFYGALQRLY